MILHNITTCTLTQPSLGTRPSEKSERGFGR